MSTPTVADYAPRVALITGAARGIGRAIALRLADDGIDVAVNDIVSQQTQKRSARLLKRSRAREGDPSLYSEMYHSKDVKSIVEQTAEVLGGVDIMVANAGFGFVVPLLEMNMTDFDQIVAVNIRGVMLCYKYADLQMVKQGCGGGIIGTSSLLGRKGHPMTSAYSATKFAIRGLTQSLSQELSPRKITVNAYAPGVINTPMTIDKGIGGPGSGLKKACPYELGALNDSL